jgi:hypothetical protein
MTIVTLRANCAQCAALCCVAPALDRSAAFAIDKAASAPCQNLDACGGCSIHADRASKGFSGCISYDCFGAGQRVTQQIFEGRSWLTEPELLPAMSAAFLAMRRVHELLLLLNEAGKLPLDVAQCDARTALLSELEPADDWTADMLAAASLDAIARRTGLFLRSLRSHVRSAPRAHA